MLDEVVIYNDHHLIFHPYELLQRLPDARSLSILKEPMMAPNNDASNLMRVFRNHMEPFAIPLKKPFVILSHSLSCTMTVLSVLTYSDLPLELWINSE